jgi:hypothetical protein
MFYLVPENVWQELPSDISNIYSFNTVLHQRIKQQTRTLDKSAVLLPHPSNSASFLRRIIRHFTVVSLPQSRDSNKFLHYYPYHVSPRLNLLSVIHLSTGQFLCRCAVTCAPNDVSTSLHSKQRKIQQTMQGVPSNLLSGH